MEIKGIKTWKESKQVLLNVEKIHPEMFFFLWQTVTEKHKMNVPETMNEVLDMSDDEGIK